MIVTLVTSEIIIFETLSFYSRVRIYYEKLRKNVEHTLNNGSLKLIKCGYLLAIPKIKSLVPTI